MEKRVKPFKYNGSIDGYYPIFLKNLFFNIITLGIYGSWATTYRRRYLIGHTQFFEKNYEYHGTGIELFIGRIKALGLLIALFIIFLIYSAIFSDVSQFMMLVGIFAYIIAFITIIPIALVGALKYRLSRTSWNDIRHNFKEHYKTFIPEFLKGTFYSIITLGIYYPFFLVNIWRFVFNNSQAGDKNFHFNGTGGDFFIIVLKGFFLTPLTLGIYSFWYLANVWNFVINSISLNGKSFYAKISAGDVFALVVPNILILIFTLGLGWPIVVTRILTFYSGKIEMDAAFDPAAIHPGPVDMETATGEGLGTLLDLDL